MGAPPEVSDAELLAAIRLHKHPAVTAGDIAERVGLTPQAVNKRLPRLVDEGLVHKKEVGAAAVVYWLTEAGQERVFADASG